ncbi:hypothetical protein N2152v2_002563 [Parachlorella kessleri]
MTDAPVADAWAHGAVQGLREALQRFLDAFLAPGTGPGTQKAVEESAYCFHDRVLGAFIRGGSGCTATLLEFLRSSFGLPTTKPGELKSLEAALRQVAAGSLVASALLRCLHLDGACRQLGTSHAYRLASSVQVALGLGSESARLIAGHAAAFSSTIPRADLPACLALVLCIHLAAVGDCCQLLRQEAGTQLQQALQRTVCEPMKLVGFWYNTLEALDALEKGFPGSVSKNQHLWKVLASLLYQLYPADASALPLLKGWDSNPRNLTYWNCLQRLVDACAMHLLSVPQTGRSLAWAGQWCLLAAAARTATLHLVQPPMPGALQMLAAMSNAVPWPLGGQRSTTALLTAGTLRLLRLLQPQQGAPASNCSRKKLCQALGGCAGTLFIVCRLSLEQGGATPKRVQSCMEALTLGLAALGYLVDAAAGEGAAGAAATSWLGTTALPALQLLSLDNKQDSSLWLSGTTGSGLEGAPDLPAAAAGAAEAALRTAAACVKLAAEKTDEVAAKLSVPCMKLAEVLGHACPMALAEQYRGPRRFLLQDSLKSAACNMGLSAVKLALTVVSLAASARPGSFVWKYCEAIMRSMQAAVDQSYSAALMSFGSLHCPSTQR